MTDKVTLFLLPGLCNLGEVKRTDLPDYLEKNKLVNKGEIILNGIEPTMLVMDRDEKPYKRYKAFLKKEY